MEKLSVNDLIVNKDYTNKEVTEAFKCSPQGGMRRSHRTNTLVLISNHTGNTLYGDKWVGDLLHYTGMGQQGDQSLSFMQNKTLAQSARNNIEVHLFEVYEDKVYTYAGKVKLNSAPYKDTEVDANNRTRSVYRFPLELLDEYKRNES